MITNVEHNGEGLNRRYYNMECKAHGRGTNIREQS